MGRRVTFLDGDVTLLDCEVTFLDGRAAPLDRGVPRLLCCLKPDAQLVVLLSKLLELRGDGRRSGECLIQHSVGLVVIRRPSQAFVLKGPAKRS